MIKHTLSLAVLASLSLSACAHASERTRLVFDAEGRPSAEVAINDTQSFLFAVDTAAQRTGVGAPIIDALGLEPDPDMFAQMHGVAGVVTVPMFELSSIEMGERRIEDSHVVSLTGGHDQGGHAHEGILGQDVFAGSQLVMDFAEMELGFDLAEETVTASLPAELFYGGFVLVDIEVGGVPTRALIDTGAATSFASPELLERLAGPRQALESSTERRGVSQDEIEVIRGLNPVFDIGGIIVPATPLDMIDSPTFQTFSMADRPAIVLGMDVLSQLPGFAIDYPASRFHLIAG